jgi:uncharacterized protein YhjY with autotransporter beta-barrel domain
MDTINSRSPNIRNLSHRVALLVVLLLTAALPFFSRSRDKYETIEATAMGTGTQLGSVINVSLEIYEFSTEQDRQMLIQAFEKSKSRTSEYTEPDEGGRTLLHYRHPRI